MTRFLFLFGVLLMLASCADKHGHDHPHDGDDHASGGHDHDETSHAGSHDDHGHGGHEDASETVTIWGEDTQLFVEFRALVVGEESAFAAHLTRLIDHSAVDSGRVVVELSGGAHPAENFAAYGPTTPGIFRPVIRPAHEGPRRVVLHFDSGFGTETHDLGEFTVFSSRAQANAAEGHEHESEDHISYLLEQQWKIPFGVERIAKRSVRPNIPAFARLVQPPDAEVLVTAPRDGRVVAGRASYPLVGERVAQGDVLFRLVAAPQGGADPATLDLAVDQARIQVAAARREVDRLTPLVEQGVVPRRRLDEARSSLATAEAELKSARRRRGALTQVSRIGKGQSGLGIPNPLGGAIAELFVSPGTWVSEGTPLARVVDRDRLVLHIGVPETYVGKIDEISGAWFQFDHVPGIFDLPRTALASVGTELDARSRTLPVRFRVDNERGQLFAGMHTRARLIVDEPYQAATVPVSALIDDAGTQVVYVQLGGERFERRAVRLGTRDGNYIEVLEGVAPGEWVVTRGAYSVKLASTSTQDIGHGHAH